jgi:AIPR protein
MDQSEFLSELRQMVLRRASAMHLVDTLAFITEVAERLEEDPVFGEFVLAEYASQDSRKRQLKIHGFTDLDDSDGTISLVIGRWADGDEPVPLLTSDVAQLRSCLENFTVEALSRKLDERIEPSSQACALASTLRNRKSEISCIRLHIFSNQILTQRFKREFRSSIAGIATETHIWDLQRLMALYGSDRERELVEINFSDFKSNGIPCIEASKADGLKSYLCVMEGDVLADLFERYGSRLLEGNVRSFLGMKGGVNKGIRTTIQNTPPLFFAYNNGIAATALSVRIDRSDGIPRITGISDLQIVNGGQTTASVLRARKQDDLSLAAVTVPMKLTVVTREQANDLIPKIAEYANTQNKVAIADFFANHPFHRKMEEISRRLLVPARAGARIQSKWFYERSRGQFQNERLYLTKAKKDAFDLEYPARQVINKTELAKYDSTFSERPHWTSLGAQKNFIRFAGQFSTKGDKTEAECWAEISSNFGEDYYRRIASIAILWKAGEEIVAAGKGSWYLGDYRPQIVAYTWSLIFRALRGEEREPNMDVIWERQEIDQELSKCFKRAAVLVQKALLDLPAGSTNVGEWAKKEACWGKVSRLDLRVENCALGMVRGGVETRRGRAETPRRSAKQK